MRFPLSDFNTQIGEPWLITFSIFETQTAIVLVFLSLCACVGSKKLLRCLKTSKHYR